MYKVFVVDDEYRVKERLFNLSEWENSNFTFCGEASDGEMALSLISEMKPDIVITDIEMPFMNGIELAEILKSTMPWIRVIFLSGYDDFDYAKKALKMGVSDYILKPFKYEELRAIMDRVVEEIEVEKEANMTFLSMKGKLETIEALRKDNLFEQLISGRIDTMEVIKNAKDLDIEILAKAYMVLDVHITSNQVVDYLKIQYFCLNQLDKISSVLWYYRLDDRLILILLGEDSKDIIEKSFSLASVIQYEVSKIIGHKGTIGIGQVVKRIGGISDSWHSANKARSYLSDLHLGQILYIDDINKQMMDSPTAYYEGKYETIRRLEKEDVEEFVSKILLDHGMASGLMGYYSVVSIIFECVDLIVSLGGKPERVLPVVNEKEMIQLYATDQKALEKLVKETLIETIKYRHQNSTNKYHNIIKTAKDYIKKHYLESSISLNSVAKEVNLSPNHFSMIFSNETNHTFIEYLTKTRLDQARVLLEESSKRLSDIAYEVGYNEPQYFSYIFKKNMGVSPRDYRNKLKQ